MVKKTLFLGCQLMLSSFQICQEVQTPYCGRRPDISSFLDVCPIYIFFQLPKLNKCCLGVELDPAHQVVKKLKMDHL